MTPTDPKQIVQGIIIDLKRISDPYLIGKMLNELEDIFIFRKNRILNCFQCQVSVQINIFDICQFSANSQTAGLIKTKFKVP